MTSTEGQEARRCPSPFTSQAALAYTRNFPVTNVVWVASPGEEQHPLFPHLPIPNPCLGLGHWDPREPQQPGGGFG